MSGSSAADKAAHARALADMAWADARKKVRALTWHITFAAACMHPGRRHSLA